MLSPYVSILATRPLLFAEYAYCRGVRGWAYRLGMVAKITSLDATRKRQLHRRYSRPLVVSKTVFLSRPDLTPKGRTMAKNILIVDDNAYIRDALCRTFKCESQFEFCGEPGNGKEAIARALQLHRDLI